MNDPPENETGHDVATSTAREAGSPERQTEHEDTTAYRVIVNGNRLREWGRYADRDEAERNARQLRRHGLDARIEACEEPEHRNDRRRFITFCVMTALVKPERMTERILQEVADAEVVRE